MAKDFVGRRIHAAVYLHDYTAGYKTCIDHIECPEDYTVEDYMNECELNGCDWLDSVPLDHFCVIEIEVE